MSSKYDASEERRTGTSESRYVRKRKIPKFSAGSAELIWATTGGGAFSNIDHLLEIGEGMRDRQKHQDDAKKTKLKGLVR